MVLMFCDKKPVMNNLFIMCFYCIYLTRAARAYRFSCSENEIYQSCRPPCQPTCQNAYVPGCRNYPCKPGCICKPGRIRDELSGQCIIWRYCQIECPPNEVPSTHGNRCEPTCQYTRMQCGFQIKWCICRPGLLRDLISGKCITPAECARISICKENEVWTECSDDNCRATCKRRKPKVCPTPCKPGCSCKDGYLWDECVKRCVPKLQCTPECDKNEDWCIKLPDYVATCQNILDTHCQDCNDPLPEGPRPGCICIKGFIWDEVSQQCVRLEECPTGTTNTSSTTTAKPSDTTSTARTITTTTVASTTTTSTSIMTSPKSSTSTPSSTSESSTSISSSTLSGSSSTTETTGTPSRKPSTSPPPSTSESSTSISSSTSSGASSTTESTTHTTNSTASTSKQSSVTSSSVPLTSSSTHSTSVSTKNPLPSIEPVTVTPD